MTICKLPMFLCTIEEYMIGSWIFLNKAAVTLLILYFFVDLLQEYNTREPLYKRINYKSKHLRFKREPPSMYELPLMGHTLVTYCWGGKSQNSRRSLGACLKATLLLSKQVFLACCLLDLWPSFADADINLKDVCFFSNLIGGENQTYVFGLPRVSEKRTLPYVSNQINVLPSVDMCLLTRVCHYMLMSRI